MQILSSNIDAATEMKFDCLKDEWRQDTMAISSVTKLCTHPVYQKIIGMDPAMIPLILRELKTEPDHGSGR